LVIGEIKVSPNFFFLIMLRIGELTTAQMLGPAPFPWHMPCMGALQFFLLCMYDLSLRTQFKHGVGLLVKWRKDSQLQPWELLLSA
jgi:hypothetical protein